MADFGGGFVSVAEEEGNAPQSRQTHEGENDSAEGGSLSAEKPSQMVQIIFEQCLKHSPSQLR